MASMKDLLDKSVISVTFEKVDPKVFGIILGMPTDGEVVAQVYSLIAAASPALPVSSSAIQAALYQDDDAHDTCSLTACLNPLHPGPCKGWKHTLHEVSPAAWHALEAARVEKANHKRIAKIEALKSAGKPIPHKLLQPILPKAHPNVGQTAAKATGEAHIAGKEVSANAGVKVSTPGKVTLGQAIKTLSPPKLVEKGPKGKKPTLGSKGIAFVIAQEKVTPQYKLDKAAGITPEQWSALSEADKSSIRGELAKIKIDGFGPQQKKADELLAKLTVEQPKPVELKPGTPGTITTPSGKTYQKITLKDLKEGPSPQAPSPVKAAGPTSLSQAAALKTITEAIHGSQVLPVEKVAQNIDMMKSGGKAIEEHQGFPQLVNNLAQAALKKASADQMPGLGHGANEAGISEFNHEIAAHIKEGKPGLPPLVAKMAAHHEKTTVESKNIFGEHSQVTKVNHPKYGDEAKAPEAPNLAPDEKPKPLPAHVQHAIEMAKGQAPGASWSKNHLAAYQPLSAEEFHALPKDVQDKVVSELTKAQSKFLDPKKIQAAKDLLTKFGKGEGPKVAAPKVEKTVDFAADLHDHSVTQAQAKEAAAKAPVSAHFLAATHSAGLTALDNPDSGGHALNGIDDAKLLVSLKTKGYDPKILSQPDVKAAVDDLQTAAAKEAYAQSVGDAKAKALNKISLALTSGGGMEGLSPIEKASLQHYQKYLLGHPVKTDTATMDALKADTKKATTALDDKLHAALKQANAPKPEDMSPAQIADRAKELMGDEAVAHKISLTLAEVKNAANVGQYQADLIAGKYPPGIITDPTVAAKHADLAQAAGQLLATHATKEKLAEHLKNHHEAYLKYGGDLNGKALTAADKKVIESHAKQIKDSYGYLDTSQAAQESKLAAVTTQFHTAAAKAQGNLTPAEPHKLTDYDQSTVHVAYAGAWGKAVSKAVVYGIKTYGTKTQMKEHPEYAGFTQDLGNLQQLAGKVAVAHALEHTAQLNIPTDPETGNVEKGPQYDAWLKAQVDRQELESQFKALHAQAQSKLDTIRTAAGLQKRALPKVDSPGVKTQAAESAYYKTSGYSGPLYGKSASAKQYLVAKVGPKLAVAHKTSAEKADEKYTKQATKAAEVAKSMPAPKVHVKPPSSEKGKSPNAESAASLGYHFAPKVVEGDQHSWPTSDKAAYVSSPEHLAELKQHLGKEDTKYGLAAQKEFKWSIDNMEDKGAAHAGQAALYSYTGSSYSTINAKLNGLPPGAKSPGGQISSIDAAFAAAPPLEGDVVLYRGFSSPESVFKSGKWNDVNVAGVEWSQRSYSSTSGELGTAQSFAGHNGVVMRIIIPKELGVKGINAQGGQHPGENEIILQRGIRYRVVADYGKGPNDNRRYIDVMVVPNPYDKSE